MNRQILTTIVFIAIIIFFVWQYFLPTFDTVSALRAEAKTWQAKLDDTQNLSRKLAELKKKYVSLASEVDRVNQAITEQQDLPGLLVQLENLASQNGLILNNIAFGDSNDQKNKKPASLAAGVKTLSIDLSLNGSQNSLKAFLGSIESNLRIMDVSAISFNEPDASVTSGQDFSLSLSAYYR